MVWVAAEVVEEGAEEGGAAAEAEVEFEPMEVVVAGELEVREVGMPGRAVPFQVMFLLTRPFDRLLNW